MIYCPHSQKVQRSGIVSELPGLGKAVSLNALLCFMWLSILLQQPRALGMIAYKLQLKIIVMPLITMIIMISGTGLGSPGLPRIGRKKWFCAETDSGSLWQWQWGLWGSSFKPQETFGEWSPYCKGKERDTVSELFLEVKDSELGVRISPMSQFCPLSTMDPITSKCW
jgi:hypothetical protein